MKLLTTLGRLLAVLFWLALLANLAAPLAKPFALLLELAGAAVLGLHVLLLALCHARLRCSARPTRERLLLLLFGVFYLDALPAPEVLVEPLLQATREPAAAAQPEAAAAAADAADGAGAADAEPAAESAAPDAEAVLAAAPQADEAAATGEASRTPA